MTDSDAIATEIAFRYAWFTVWLRRHTLVEVAFFEELKSDAAPWERLVSFFGVCANASDVRAALGENSLARLQQRGYTVARKGEICLLYTSPSPRDATLSRMPSSA